MSAATRTITRIERFLGRADLVRWAGMACIGLGVSLLLVASWVEYLNDPSISLVDAYWIGRTPWTPAGIVLVLAGSAATLLAGGVVVLVVGDRLRRLLLVPVLIPPLAWWITALGLVGFPRLAGPDPVAFAYAMPQVTAVALVVPALAITALAIVPMRPDPRVRLRRVHDPGHRPRR